MRVPLSKMHRAFVELDPFTDEQCLGYISTARRRRPLFVFLGGLVAFILMIVVWIVAGTGVSWIGQMSIAPLLGRRHDELIFAISFGSVTFLGVLAGLIARDLGFRLLIRSELKGAKCPKCNYSLLGLRVEAEAVVCPECGKRCQLSEMGLTPEDLLAEVGEC